MKRWLVPHMEGHSIGKKILQYHERSKVRVTAGEVNAIIAGVISLVALWFSSRNFPQNVGIFYWPLAFEISTLLRCLPFPIAIASVLFGLRKVKCLRNLELLALPLILIGICAFIQYTAIWAARSIIPIGTVRYGGNVYHLASISQFDERNRYFIGQCEHVRYWCRFHEIFQTNPFISREIELVNTSLHLQVKVDGEAVYIYDGAQERCVPWDVVICE